MDKQKDKQILVVFFCGVQKPNDSTWKWQHENRENHKTTTTKGVNNRPVPSAPLQSKSTCLRFAMA